MIDFFQNIVFFILPIFFVIFGTFHLLSSSINILAAKRIKNISIIFFLILLVIELPILSLNLNAGLYKYFDLIAYNIIGINIIMSSITILLLISNKKFSINNQRIRKDSIILIIITLIIFIFLLDRLIAYYESLILIILLIIYLIYKIKFSVVNPNFIDNIINIFGSSNKSRIVNLITLVLSIMLIVLYANYFLISLGNVSLLMNIENSIIALSIIPLVYSIVFITKARKSTFFGEQNYSLSLLINFNIINILSNFAIIGMDKNNNLEGIKWSELSILIILAVSFYIISKFQTELSKKDIYIFIILLLIYIFMIYLKI
jgi:cation:H+ antiporter